jgi:hypothetical protein
VARVEQAGFADPTLATFFDHVLGNLPLSVALCGQMFRAEQSRIGSEAALVAEIEAISVDELSAKVQRQGPRTAGAATASATWL